MTDLSIGEVALRTGVSVSAIRYYERRRLLAEPPRRSGRRCYDPAIVPRVRAIRAARSAGLGVRAIAELLGASATRGALDSAIGRQIDTVDRQMAALANLKDSLERLAACGCASPARCDMPF